jgi:hypothetical protein
MAVAGMATVGGVSAKAAPVRKQSVAIAEINAALPLRHKAFAHTPSLLKRINTPQMIKAASVKWALSVHVKRVEGSKNFAEIATPPIGTLLYLILVQHIVEAIPVNIIYCQNGLWSAPDHFCSGIRV